MLFSYKLALMQPHASVLLASHIFTGVVNMPSVYTFCEPTSIDGFFAI